MTDTGRRCTQRASRLNTPSWGGTSPKRRMTGPTTGDCCQRTRAEQATAGDREQRRHEGQRGEQSDDHDAHPGGAERAHQLPREEHEPAEADGHDEPGEQHSAPGCRERAPHGELDGRPVVDVVVHRVQLLAEPADDEEPVVDRQPQPHHAHDIDDGGVEIEDVREAEQGQQRPRDRRNRTHDREPRGEESHEDDDHDREAQRQRDELAGDQVRLHLLDHRVDDERLATDLPGRARCGAGHGVGQPVQPILDRGNRLIVGLGCQTAVEVHGHQEATPVRCDERLRGRVLQPAREAGRVDNVMDAGDRLEIRARFSDGVGQL